MIQISINLPKSHHYECLYHGHLCLSKVVRTLCLTKLRTIFVWNVVNPFQAQTKRYTKLFIISHVWLVVIPNGVFRQRSVQLVVRHNIIFYSFSKFYLMEKNLHVSVFICMLKGLPYNSQFEYLLNHLLRRKPSSSCEVRQVISYILEQLSQQM